MFSEAIFEAPTPRTDEDKLARRKSALDNFQTFLRPLIQLPLGKDQFEKGTELVFESLQDPRINKQVKHLTNAKDTFLTTLFVFPACVGSSGYGVVRTLPGIV